MRFSVSIPTCREGLSLPLPFGSPDDATRIALRAEDLGYHSVWANDHITPPAYVSADYDTPPRWIEPLITLAFVAARTRGIRLGTAVLVLPMRDPVWVAKQVSTLDVLSGGRMILGVGVGAYREEFEHLRPRDATAHRGEMLTEGMQVLNKLFFQRRASHDGKYYAFDQLEIYPKPIQDPFPLYACGNSTNEIKRAVLYGTGWVPASMAIDRLAASIEKLHCIAEEAGRDPAEIEIAPQVMVAMGHTEEEAVDRFLQSRMKTHLQTLHASTLRNQEMHRDMEANLVGTPRQIVDRVGQLENIGVSMLSSQSFLSQNVEDMLEQIQFFAEEVLPFFTSRDASRQES